METRTEEIPAAQVEITLAVWSPRRREQPDPTPPSPPARLPRITRLMALAIKFQEMVDRGDVRDYADVARLGYVTRARVTQIMNLLTLAPDIQEEIISDGGSGRSFPSERDLRAVGAFPIWTDQRKVLRGLRESLKGN
jgi:hypothetical protein